jgi:CRISPR-associated protein Csm1
MENKETEPKYLLKGDLSGIQDFIFSIPSKGATKTLKVRSFFIQAITQLCIKKLMTDYGLDEERRISDRGGSFYLGMNEKITNIEELQAQLNEKLFHLGLFLTLSQTHFDTWNTANSRLSEQEEKQKYQKYAHSTNLFNTFERKSQIDLKCWKSFANNLSATKARYEIAPNKSEMPILTHNSISLFDYTLTLSTSGKNSPTSFNEAPVWREENIYFQKMNEDSNIKDWVSESADTEDEIIEHSAIDLTHLGLEARYRTGTDKIAAIALDVDNLGEFFKGKKDIAELKSAEKDLKEFFINKIGDVWRSGTFNGDCYYCDNILILFSGGDDCFILGAWDASIYFLNLLHEKFEQFVDKKLSINGRPLTFSASILITDSSFPMIRLGDMTKDMLTIAKKGKKDAVCLFEQKFTWQEFNDIISIAQTLRNLIVNKNESKALVQKVALSARGYKSLVMGIKRRKPINMEKVWNLTWFILRGAKKENQQEVDEKIVRKYHEAVISALKNKEYSNALVYPFAARIAELLIRNKR